MSTNTLRTGTRFETVENNFWVVDEDSVMCIWKKLIEAFIKDMNYQRSKADLCLYYYEDWTEDSLVLLWILCIYACFGCGSREHHEESKSKCSWINLTVMMRLPTWMKNMMMLDTS